MNSSDSPCECCRRLHKCARVPGRPLFTFRQSVQVVALTRRVRVRASLPRSIAASDSADVPPEWMCQRVQPFNVSAAGLSLAAERRPERAAIHATSYGAQWPSMTEQESQMRYMFAWMLGVPFSLIVVWYILGHAFGR